MEGRANNGRFCSRECQVDSLNAAGPSTMFRLPVDLKDALRQAAEDRDVSMNWLATRLIRAGLEDLIPANELKLTR